MRKEFAFVDVLDSVRGIHDSLIETGLDFFLVRENSQVVGAISYKDIIRAHPNRIAADAMSAVFKSVSLNTSIWKAKQIFEESSIEVLLVVDDKKHIAGYITPHLINEEISKHIDALTGLYKSDYIYYHGARLIKSSKDTSVLFIDVNNFGLFNKLYGHISGDIVLKEIGMLIKANIPEEFYLCRFGGDEFVAVAECHTCECEELAGKILNNISAHLFSNRTCVNVSAGIAGIRGYDKKDCNALNTISDLVNIASLESTKAKGVSSCLSVVQVSDINNIA